ncbi:MAG TPA: isopentenyl-diphosphate Delta-isomerase [Acidobacteriota bacterium]|nr:isopentenyl-diphosphate Delta-isomerase [Acidobacteriota bacterium]
MDVRVKEVLDVIRTSFHKPITVNRLARRVNLSSSRLSSLFKEELGQSIKTIQKDQRLTCAASLLTGGNLRISEIAYQVGFNDLSNFSRAFKARTGRTPKQYRQRFRSKALSLSKYNGNGYRCSEVVVVDRSGRQVGVCDKIEAHRRGLLHRAFSIFIFNSQGQLLLQRRALSKYHSRGLWSNSCCSHPRPGGVLIREAQLRLLEEMGFTCALREMFTFTYSAQVEAGLREHEVDHVLAGRHDGGAEPNPREVAEWAWKDVRTLRQEIRDRPSDYTAWLKICFETAIRSAVIQGILDKRHSLETE